MKMCVSVPQTVHRSAGGLEVWVEDRFTLTGVGLHTEAVSVPAACSKTVWTPSTSATAMLTVTNGT